MRDMMSEQEIALRFDRLGEMVDDFLRCEDPADRDRRIQRYMSQAMSPERRLDLLNEMTDFVFATYLANQERRQ